MTALIALACAILGALAGFYSRKLYDALLRVESAVHAIVVRQKEVEQKEKRMTFAGPVNLDEMTDEEKIDYLNP